MPIPFKAKIEPEIVDVAGFQLPKYGSLSVREQELVFDLNDRREEFDFGEEASVNQMLRANNALKLEVVTLMLQRVDPGWTLEKTRSDKWEVGTPEKSFQIVPTTAMLDELFEFAMGEQRRWKEPVSRDEAPTAKKRSTGKKSSTSSAAPTPA